MTIKPLEEMVKNNRIKCGYDSKCKICLKKQRQEYYSLNKNKINEKSKIWRENNPNKVSEYNAEHRKNNPNKIKIYQKEYTINNKTKLKNYGEVYRKNNLEKQNEYNLNYYKKNSEKIKENAKNYRENNKEIINNRRNERIKNDPLFKIRVNVSKSILKIIKRYNLIKRNKTSDILGCSYIEFLHHIESQWVEKHNLTEYGEVWMCWDNYGKYNGEFNYGWDIDHIIPLSSARTEKELLNLFNYKNQQPLCSYTNRYIKSDTLPL